MITIFFSALIARFSQIAFRRVLAAADDRSDGRAHTEPDCAGEPTLRPTCHSSESAFPVFSIAETMLRNGESSDRPQRELRHRPSSGSVARFAHCQPAFVRSRNQLGAPPEQ